MIGCPRRQKRNPGRYFCNMQLCAGAQRERCRKAQPCGSHPSTNNVEPRRSRLGERMRRCATVCTRRYGEGGATEGVGTSHQWEETCTNVKSQHALLWHFVDSTEPGIPFKCKSCPVKDRLGSRKLDPPPFSIPMEGLMAREKP